MAVDGVLERELGDKLLPPRHIIQFKNPPVTVGFARPEAGSGPRGVEHRIPASPKADIGDGAANGAPIVGAIVVIGIYFILVQPFAFVKRTALREGVV